MGRRKQEQPKRCKSDDKTSEKEDNDDGPEETNSGEESDDKLKMEEDKIQETGEITSNGDDKVSDEETVLDDNESGPKNSEEEMENKQFDIDVEMSSDEIEKEHINTTETKEDDKLNKEKTKEPKRSETPPLKRLMRQDPLPLFMNSRHHSPPKKIFKEEHLHSSKWQVPLVPTPAFLTNIKNAPMHPRQHMLKSKPYSNRLFLSPAAISSFHSMGYQTNPKSYDNDQPLDLSKKTGNMKSSTSSLPTSSSSHSSHNGKSSSRHSADSIHLKSRHKYSNGLFPENIKSSLQSLQQKFGGDYHTRLLHRPIKGLHSMSHEMFYKQPTAENVMLNSISSLPKKKSPIPSFTEAGKKSSEEKSESPINNHRDLNSNFKKPNSVCDNDEDKHTRHKCVCTKTFTSLYDLSIHIQETGHLPAGVKKANLMEYPKLVRGQDMWLNTESEQTKRILRCMQCGESFKSLPMLTVHMMQTQHYTKIVSSEHGRRTHKCSAYCDRDIDRECVFKCKVCNSMFVDMEGLANHMILSGHHKRNVIHTSNHTDMGLKSQKQNSTDVHLENESREKNGCHARLSPLERVSASSPDSDLLDDSMISCENCGTKIETNSFVEHVRACLHQSMVNAFESRIQKLKSQVNNLQSKTPDGNVGECSDKLREDVKERESTEVKSEIPDTVKQESCDETQSEATPELTEKNELIKSDLIKKEPLESDNVEMLNDTNQNEKSKEKSPLMLDSSKMLDILNPESVDDKEGDSALQAMESFINKSFTSKFTYGKNKFQMNLFSKQESLSPLLKFEKYRKYFQPSLMMESSSTKSEESETNENNDTTKDELEKLEKLCENVNKRQPSPKLNTKTETSEQKESKKGLESLSNKYLNLDEEERNQEKSSALDSLSSFVYGQSLDSEHPLDKLQKLITKTDIPGMSSSSRTIVNGSPESSVPLNLTVKKELDDDDLMDEMLSDGSHSDSGSDSAVEYHCVACSRHFASKGTYRYHLSRCHLSTIKKYGIKEAFNMSPYVYLPLDHTAKFSKYFKMAEELVKKEQS